MESVVENLTSELSISRDLAHALRVENEDLKAHLNHYSAELATALQKNENYKRELQTWEAKYKEWMHMMENRVENINRTHQVLQVSYFCKYSRILFALNYLLLFTFVSEQFQSQAMKRKMTVAQSQRSNF